MSCIAAVSPKSLDAMMLQGHTDPTRNAAAFSPAQEILAGFDASVLHAPGLTIETRAMLLERVRRLHSDLTAAQASHTHAPHASQYARACELGNARTPPGMLPLHATLFVMCQTELSACKAMQAACAQSQPAAFPVGNLGVSGVSFTAAATATTKPTAAAAAAATTTKQQRQRACAHARAHTHTHTHAHAHAHAHE